MKPPDFDIAMIHQICRDHQRERDGSEWKPMGYFAPEVLAEILEQAEQAKNPAPTFVTDELITLIVNQSFPPDNDIPGDLEPAYLALKFVTKIATREVLTAVMVSGSTWPDATVRARAVADACAAGGSTVIEWRAA